MTPPVASQSQPLSQTSQERAAEIEHSDVQNREKISLVVLGISIASILLISITYIAQSSNKENAAGKVMDSTLPLYGTWVGTILAFYFSRNSFEAASSANSRNAAMFKQATSGLVSSPPPDDPLTKISVKSLANNLVFSQTDLDTPLQDVLKAMVDKNRFRVIVVNAEKKYVDLIYRINAAAFLDQRVGQAQAQVDPQAQAQVDPQAQAQVDPQAQAQVDPQAQAQVDPQAQAQVDPQAQAQVDPQAQAQVDPQAQAQVDPQAQATSLKQYLDWRHAQGDQAQPKVVYLAESASLADADAKLKELPGCDNVIVTTDGQPSSPVVVYITDNDINEYR